MTTEFLELDKNLKNIFSTVAVSIAVWEISTNEQCLGFVGKFENRLSTTEANNILKLKM